MAIRDLPTEESAEPPPVTPLQLIKAVPIFQSLDLDEKKALAEAAVVREFSSGEVIARRDQPATNLTIVRSGVVSMRRDHEELGRLAPGDSYGGTGLFADIEEACTLEALGNVVVYEIKQQALAALLAERPTLAQSLNSALANREKRTPPSVSQIASESRNNGRFSPQSNRFSVANFCGRTISNVQVRSRHSRSLRRRLGTLIQLLQA